MNNSIFFIILFVILASIFSCGFIIGPYLSSLWQIVIIIICPYLINKGDIVSELSGMIIGIFMVGFLCSDIYPYVTNIDLNWFYNGLDWFFRHKIG